MPCILIVDNDHDTRDAMMDVLALEGHTVEVAVDGESAMQQLIRDEQLPSVVLLDNLMPKMSGLQFLDWLQQHPRFARTSVILTTGDLRALSHPRARAVLRKPYDIDELLNAVRDLCRH